MYVTGFLQVCLASGQYLGIYYLLLLLPVTVQSTIWCIVVLADWSGVVCIQCRLKSSTMSIKLCAAKKQHFLLTELNLLYLMFEILNRGTLDDIGRKRVPHSDGVWKEGLLVDQSAGKWDTVLIRMST